MDASTSATLLLRPCFDFPETVTHLKGCLLHSNCQCALEEADALPAPTDQLLMQRELTSTRNQAVALICMEQFQKHLEKWFLSFHKTKKFSCIPVTARLKIRQVKQTDDAVTVQIVCDFLLVPQELFSCVMKSKSSTLQRPVQVITCSSPSFSSSSVSPLSSSSFYSLSPTLHPSLSPSFSSLFHSPSCSRSPSPPPLSLDPSHSASVTCKKTDVYRPKVTPVRSISLQAMIRERRTVVDIIRQRAAGHPFSHKTQSARAYKTWLHVFSILSTFIKRPPGSCRNRLMRVHETRWLEVIDPEHRSGTELYEAWQKWKVSPIGENVTRVGLLGVNFFDWFDQSTDPIHENIPVVTYFSDRARKSYELHGSGSKLQTGPNQFATVEKGKFGTNNLPCPHTADIKNEPQIYVISASFKAYLTTYKKGTIQHTSMLHGEPVCAAGEVLNSQGGPEGETEKSGHYRSETGASEFCVAVNFQHHVLNVNMTHVRTTTGCVEEPFSGMVRDTRGQVLLVSKPCFEKYLKMSKAGVFWGNFHEWLKHYWIPSQINKDIKQNPELRVPASVKEFLAAEEDPIPPAVLEFFASYPVKAPYEEYLKMLQANLFSGTFYEWLKNFWIPKECRSNPDFYVPTSVIEFLVPEKAPIPAPVAEFLSAYISISVMEFLAVEQAHNQRARALRLAEIQAECTAWELSRQTVDPSMQPKKASLEQKDGPELMLTGHREKKRTVELAQSEAS